MWKHNRQIRAMPAGTWLRILAASEFVLHWSDDDWQNAQDSHASPTAVGVYYVDIPTKRDQRAPIRFTFHWSSTGTWEGADYEVRLTAAKESLSSAIAQSSGRF